GDDAFADQRMQDRFEAAAFLVVGKDDRAELPAVEAAVLGQHVWTEGFADRVEPRFTGLDDLAGEDIRVDQRRAERAEEIGDGRFAARDAAGEADLQHRTKRLIGAQAYVFGQLE